MATQYDLIDATDCTTEITVPSLIRVRIFDGAAVNFVQSRLTPCSHRPPGVQVEGSSLLYVCQLGCATQPDPLRALSGLCHSLSFGDERGEENRGWPNGVTRGLSSSGKIAVLSDNSDKLRWCTILGLWLKCVGEPGSFGSS